MSEVHTNISDHFPKNSEDYRRLPNVSEQSSKMFRSHRNEFRFVRSTIKLGKRDSAYDVIVIFRCEDIKFIFTREDIMFSQ